MPESKKVMPESNAELVRRVRDSLPDSHRWDEREAAILELAERQAVALDMLEAGGPLDVAAHRELRLGRLAAAQLLSRLDLPGVGTGQASHARRAARVRWKAS